MLSLKRGDSLTYADYTLCDTITGRPVAMLSQRARTTIMHWKEKGYEVKSASIRFIVAWKPKDAPKEEPETAILLPDLILARKPNA